MSDQLAALCVDVWEAKHGGLVSVRLGDFIPPWLCDQMIARGVVVLPSDPSEAFEGMAIAAAKASGFVDEGEEPDEGLKRGARTMLRAALAVLRGDLK